MPEQNQEVVYLLGLLQRTIAARKARGWSQRFVADALGIPLERYKKYEQRTAIPVHLIERFCLLTGTDILFFVTGKKTTISPQKAVYSQEIRPELTRFAENI